MDRISEYLSVVSMRTVWVKVSIGRDGWYCGRALEVNACETEGVLMYVRSAAGFGKLCLSIC